MLLQRMVDLDERPPTPSKFAHMEYRYLTEFQSHDPEFDYLKSMEIEEKINQVKWVDRNSQSQYILSTNDKTVKLWRVSSTFHMCCLCDLLHRISQIVQNC